MKAELFNTAWSESTIVGYMLSELFLGKWMVSQFLKARCHCTVVLLAQCQDVGTDPRFNISATTLKSNGLDRIIWLA